MLFFIEDDAILNQMLPFILMVDATMMSVLFVGSIMFFEKSEQTISTILVTPTTYHEQILSKAIANTVHMLFFITLSSVGILFCQRYRSELPILITRVIDFNL